MHREMMHPKSGAQPGIFLGQGSTPQFLRAGHTKVFTADIAWPKIFQIKKQKKYFGNIPDFATLKFNGMRIESRILFMSFLNKHFL